MLDPRLGLFDSLPDLVVAADRTGRLVYRNVAAAAVSPEARTWREWFAADPIESVAAFHRVLASNEPVELDWSVTNERGARSWYLAQVTPIAGGVLCSSRDISRLKRTEVRLRRAEQLMVDTQGVAHLGTWDWDVSQPHATWSAELYRIYGLTPDAYTPSYEAYLTMVHADDRQRVIDATNRVFHEHVPYSHDERIFRPDGTMRYLHTWAYPLLDENGKLTHLIGVCQDITDRALADEALHRANVDLERRVSERTHQLETALRDLEAFNAMVSHDLRAPLAVIRMAVELLTKDRAKVDAQAGKYYDRIDRAIETMSTLLDDLLAFARVGEGAIEPVEIDVTALCADIAGELQAASPTRTANIVIEPNLRVVADPTLFRVVIANLLGNAWKYTQRSPSPRIEVGRRDGTLFIEDNGIGFDMAEYDKLFAPFKRLTSASELPGTGIGLATVQRILERHGGSISAEGRLNEGATFYVVLPAPPVVLEAPAS